MDTFERIMEVANELEKYAVLDGSEWGETCLALINLSGCYAYISEGMSNMLLTELVENLNAAKSGATIVEEQETYTKTVRRLEWD